EASFRILDQVPAITARVEAFRARQLTGAESREFATAALRLRCEDAQKAPIGPEKLLEARRYEDAGEDLWHVFNKVSENLLRARFPNDRHESDFSFFLIPERVARPGHGELAQAIAWTLASAGRGYSRRLLGRDFSTGRGFHARRSAVHQLWCALLRSCSCRGGL